MKITVTVDNESQTFANATDAIKYLEPFESKITFCCIRGYELLSDGTQREVCTTLKEVQTLLSDRDIPYDSTITDMYDLAKSIEKDWEDYYNDGGGSGWIEY